MSTAPPPEDGLWQDDGDEAGDVPAPSEPSVTPDEASDDAPAAEPSPDFGTWSLERLRPTGEPGATPIEPTDAAAAGPAPAADDWAESADELLRDLAIPRAPVQPSEPSEAAPEEAEPVEEAAEEPEPAEEAAEEPAAAEEVAEEPEPAEEAAEEPEPAEVAPEEPEPAVAEPSEGSPTRPRDEPGTFEPPALPPPLRSVPRREVPPAGPAMSAEGLVPPRRWLRLGAQAWIALGPGDVPSVGIGDSVAPTTVVGERMRDPRVVTVTPRDRDRSRFEPGSHIAPEDLGPRGRGASTDEGTVLYRFAGTRLAIVTGREREPVHARVDGTVAAVAPGGIAVDVAGHALDGVAGAGEPVHGRLRMGVGDPGDELRSTGLHVADAGSIVVAGARVDVETLTRARALGIHGVITGGIAGHDLRAFEQSEARQQAALHPLPPFAVLVLEGFGRRSLAGPPWDLLVAAAGTSVSIFPDPPLLVFSADADLTSVAPGTVRIVAGPGAGTVGTIDGPVILHRFDDGVRLLAVPFFGGGRRSIVPLADLERFQ